MADSVRHPFLQGLSKHRGAPPTVVVTASYPGATAETLAETVAAPLEESINGVENMIYMSSSATGDGALTITITFKQGTNVDQAQVLVQNRVAVAQHVGAFSTWDLQGTYGGIKNLTLTAGVKNLFNRHHEYVWWDGTQSLHAPADGRAVYLSAQVAF